MTTKDISRLVVLAAIVISGIVLIIKLISGAVSLVSGLANVVLGIFVVIALVLIVLWMFSYAKKMGKKK